MKLNTLLGINAIVGWTTAAALLLIPDAFLSFSGVHLTGEGLVIARLLGVEFLAFNLATWPARNPEYKAARRLFVIGHATSEMLGFLVLLMAKLGGLGNSLLWGFVAVYLSLGLGFLYFLFVKPDAD